jgi:hypothetical protein
MLCTIKDETDIGSPIPLGPLGSLTAYRSDPLLGSAPQKTIEGESQNTDLGHIRSPPDAIHVHSGKTRDQW